MSGEQSRRRVHELRAARTRSRSGWAPSASKTRDSTRGTSTRRASRGASRSAPRRFPTAPSSSSAPGRSRRSCGRSLRKGSSRSCSRAGRRSRRRSSKQDLVDKLLLFVAPTFSGSGPLVVPALATPQRFTRLTSRQVGEDVWSRHTCASRNLSSCSQGSCVRWEGLRPSRTGGSGSSRRPRSRSAARSRSTASA